MVALRFGLAAFPLMVTHTAALGPTHGEYGGGVGAQRPTPEVPRSSFLNLSVTMQQLNHPGQFTKDGVEIVPTGPRSGLLVDPTGARYRKPLCGRPRQVYPPPPSPDCCCAIVGGHVYRFVAFSSTLLHS